MKAILFIVSVLLCGQAAAQTKSKVSVTSKQGLPVSVSPSAMIWSDDFSNPANWVISTPVGSGPGKDWVIGTSGPAGTYAIPPIESTTASNGFALFDSDFNCSYNQVADITTASPVDCSAYPFVRLSFEQQYRRFRDSTFVFVSNDGFSWTKYTVNLSASSDFGFSSNPEIIRVDISAAAGGQSTVWIRFQFYSPNTMPYPAGCNYAWMIDDVSVSEIVTNDLVMDQAYADFAYQDGGYYTQVPVTELVPVTFRAAVSNQGSSPQTAVQLNVKITDGAGTVYNQSSSTLPVLPYQAEDTLFISTAFNAPPVLNSYSAVFTVDQAETELPADTANNTIVRDFIVSDTVYARDNGQPTGTASPNIYIGGAADGAGIGLKYEFPAAATATSVSVYIDSTSGIGTNIEARLYEAAGSGYIEVAVSDVYTIGAPVSQWVTLPLPLTSLDAGKTYLAAIITTGISTGPDLFVVLGADVVTAQPFGVCEIYLPGTGYWNKYALLPMIRLNVVYPFAGISDKQSPEARLWNAPNPVNGLTEIFYELEAEANVSLQLSDNTGRMIRVMQQGEKKKGLHSVFFDSSGLAPGIYHYSLIAEKKVVRSQKMVIAR